MMASADYIIDILSLLSVSFEEVVRHSELFKGNRDSSLSSVPVFMESTEAIRSLLKTYASNHKSGFASAISSSISFNLSPDQYEIFTDDESDEEILKHFFGNEMLSLVSKRAGTASTRHTFGFRDKVFSLAEALESIPSLKGGYLYSLASSGLPIQSKFYVETRISVPPLESGERPGEVGFDLPHGNSAVLDFWSRILFTNFLSDKLTGNERELALFRDFVSYLLETEINLFGSFQLNAFEIEDFSKAKEPYSDKYTLFSAKGNILISLTEVYTLVSNMARIEVCKLGTSLDYPFIVALGSKGFRPHFHLEPKSVKQKYNKPTSKDVSEVKKFFSKGWPSKSVFVKKVGNWALGNLYRTLLSGKEVCIGGRHYLPLEEVLLSHDVDLYNALLERLVVCQKNANLGYESEDIEKLASSIKPLISFFVPFFEKAINTILDTTGSFIYERSPDDDVFSFKVLFGPASGESTHYSISHHDLYFLTFYSDYSEKIFNTVSALSVQFRP